MAVQMERRNGRLKVAVTKGLAGGLGVESERKDWCSGLRNCVNNDATYQIGKLQEGEEHQLCFELTEIFRDIR